jgi:hypothetical protein
MINIKPVIQAALANDSGLLAALGGEYTFHQYPPKEPPANFIIWYELDNVPDQWADEIEQTSKITIAVDPYSNGNITAIANAVDRVFVALGATRERAPDDDSETPRMSKAMAYSFIVDRDGKIY